MNTEIPEMGCGCNEFGSENSTSCDDWGQCTCKCNVEGEKCDHCSAGYFGLSSVSPTECHGKNSILQKKIWCSTSLIVVRGIWLLFE